MTRPTTKSEQESTWVRDLGKQGVVDRFQRPGCSWGLLPIVAIAGFRFMPRFIFLWIGLIVVAILGWFFLDRLSKKQLFDQIYCPYCGFNPTRRKSDGKPRQDHFKVLAELNRLTECPSCGRQALTEIGEPGNLSLQEKE